MQIKVGNDASADPAPVSSFATVASSDGVPGGTTTFTVHSSASGRYRADLVHQAAPEGRGGPSGSFGAEIFNIIVKGSS